MISHDSAPPPPVRPDPLLWHSPLQSMHRLDPTNVATLPRQRIILPRPLPSRRQPYLLRTERKARPMTIVIGMLCHGGVVVAADTQMTWSDGTTYDGTKVQTATIATGSLVVAYTCLNTNAAESLVRDLILDVTMASPKSLFGLEDTIKNRMLEWSKAYTVQDDRPDVSLVIGTHLDGDNGSEFGLYLCEPPGTIVRKTVENSHGYVAEGAGLIITDPLFRTLFGPLVSPRVCLGQLSYLMYRAKKDCRGACGGETDAVLITDEYSAPLWIERSLMKQAEFRGRFLDETLAKVASAVMSRRKLDDVSGLADIFDVYQGQLANLFRARTGEVIREKQED